MCQRPNVTVTMYLLQISSSIGAPAELVTFFFDSPAADRNWEWKKNPVKCCAIPLLYSTNLRRGGRSGSSCREIDRNGGGLEEFSRLVNTRMCWWTSGGLVGDRMAGRS